MSDLLYEKTETRAMGGSLTSWRVRGQRGVIELKALRFAGQDVAAVAGPAAVPDGAHAVWHPVELWRHVPTSWDRVPSPGEALVCEVTGSRCDHGILDPEHARAILTGSLSRGDQFIREQLEETYRGTLT